jgi:hypothetical protein
MLRLSPGGLTARKIFIVASLHYRDPEFHRAEIAVPGGRGAMNGAPGPALRCICVFPFIASIKIFRVGTGRPNHRAAASRIESLGGSIVLLPFRQAAPARPAIGLGDWKNLIIGAVSPKMTAPCGRE